MENRLYIFTITTGRSGTKYLANLFDVASDEVIGFHEFEDTVSSFRKVNANGDLLLAKMVVGEEMIPRIERNIGDNRVYVETNHRLCKGFLMPLANQLDNVKIIYLYRDFVDVVKSLLKHKAVLSPKNSHQREVGMYYRFPNDKLSLFKLNPKLRLTDFEYNLWYCFEIFKVYLNIEKNYDVYPISLSDLNDFGKVLTFFDMLGIENVNRDKLKEVVGVPVHQSKRKIDLGLSGGEIAKSYHKIASLFFKNL